MAPWMFRHLAGQAGPPSQHFRAILRQESGQLPRTVGQELGEEKETLRPDDESHSMQRTVGHM